MSEHNKTTKGLTKKQRDFIDHYLISFNAYESAVVAGYSQNVALKQSYKMLSNPKIKEEIERQVEEMRDANPAIASAEEVLAFLSKVMRGDIQDERLISSPMGVEMHLTKTQSEARLKAAELLGKANQLFTDKVNVSGSIQQQVIFEGEDELED